MRCCDPSVLRHRRRAQRDAARRHSRRAARDRRRQQLPVQRGGLRDAGLSVRSSGAEVRSVTVSGMQAYVSNYTRFELRQQVMWISTCRVQGSLTCCSLRSGCNARCKLQHRHLRLPVLGMTKQLYHMPAGRSSRRPWPGTRRRTRRASWASPTASTAPGSRTASAGAAASSCPSSPSAPQMVDERGAVSKRPAGFWMHALSSETTKTLSDSQTQTLRAGDRGV